MGQITFSFGSTQTHLMKRHSAADGLGFAEGSYIRKTIMIYYILFLLYFILFLLYILLYFIIFNYLYFNYKYKNMEYE